MLEVLDSFTRSSFLIHNMLYNSYKLHSPGYHASTTIYRTPITDLPPYKNLSRPVHCSHIRPLVMQSSLIQVHAILSVTVSILLVCLRLAHQGSMQRLALTAGTVVYNLMRKQVTIYTEVFVAISTFIATTGGSDFVTVFVELRLFLFHWYFRKRFQACKTLRASPGVAPRNIDPIY